MLTHYLRNTSHYEEVKKKKKATEPLSSVHSDFSQHSLHQAAILRISSLPLQATLACVHLTVARSVCS